MTLRNRMKNAWFANRSCLAWLLLSARCAALVVSLAVVLSFLLGFQVLRTLHLAHHCSLAPCHCSLPGSGRSSTSPGSGIEATSEALNEKLTRSAGIPSTDSTRSRPGPCAPHALDNRTRRMHVHRSRRRHTGGSRPAVAIARRHLQSDSTTRSARRWMNGWIGGSPFTSLCCCWSDCPIYTDCDSCFAANSLSAAAAPADAASPSPLSSGVSLRNGPCGWCVSSWSCMTGDIHGPTAPQTCAQPDQNWSYQTCDLADNCGGLYCNRLQTCDRDTAPDGSQTTFKCRTSVVYVKPQTRSGEGARPAVSFVSLAHRRPPLCVRCV